MCNFVFTMEVEEDSMGVEEEFVLKEVYTKRARRKEERHQLKSMIGAQFKLTNLNKWC